MYQFIFLDDEDYMREFFPPLVDWATYGFEIIGTFSNGEDALQFLRQHPVDLVISDIKMGHFSGLDFCRELRKFDNDVTIVLLSGYQDFEDARQALRYNVFDYLLKPVSFSMLDELFLSLKRHLDDKMQGTPPAMDSEKSISSEESHQIAELSNAEEPDISYLAQTAIEYIAKNYHRDLSLEEVAAHVSLNATYFSRFFKQQTGEKFIDYLSHCRIEEAKRLLDQPGSKVYAVCEQVGYHSIQHFYKIFKSYVGCTPSEYRNRKRTS